MGDFSKGVGRGFEVTVRGSTGPVVDAALEDVEITFVGETTVIRDREADQAALFGLLQRLQDLGLEILDVRHLGDDPE
jgi:hypothetical protein